MNPYGAYKMDTDKEKSGVLILENNFFRIYGARAGGKNSKYEDRREALTKPHRRAIQTGTLPKEMQDRLNSQLAVETLITRWDTNSKAGTTDEPEWVSNTIHDPATGQVVAYSTDLAVATFVKFDELYDQFVRGCSDVENFLDKDEAADDKGN